MSRILRYFTDSLMLVYTLFSIYYIYQFIIQFLHAFTHSYDFSFIFENPIRFAIIYGIIIIGHMLISLWMYVDVGKRKFERENQRVLWLGIISAGLAPFYYFYHGRND